jgi:signal recognition particle subunit SRP19
MWFDMVSRDEGKYVIYPIYFNKSVSRLSGRKVSLKNAVDNPNLEDIARVAKSLGLNPFLQKESAHPSKNWKKDGRLLIDKKDKKIRLLRQIAKHLN